MKGYRGPDYTALGFGNVEDLDTMVDGFVAFQAEVKSGALGQPPWIFAVPHPGGRPVEEIEAELKQIKERDVGLYDGEGREVEA